MTRANATMREEVGPGLVPYLRANAPRQLACEGCAFWVIWQKQLTPKHIIGDCRKHAPVVFMQPDGSFASKWPSTKSGDFCGVFQAACGAAESRLATSMSHAPVATQKGRVR